MASPTSTTIRPGRDDDGPALATLLATIFADYENCPFVPEEFPELAAPATHFGSRDGALWVATDAAGTVVGSLAVAPTFRPGTFELFKVYVAVPHRGTGLARSLLDLGLDFARNRGATRVVLWSDTRFRSGHRFYLRNGFRRTPGIRALHDVARTIEFGFARGLAGVAP